jgi:hypothetical protein
VSTGLECFFIEVEPRQWYYVLQNGDCPVQAWDWREYATAYGSFDTFEQAVEHMHKNHPNPGGYWGETYDPDAPPKVDDVLKGLIAEARR